MMRADVCADGGAGEDLPRRKLHFLAELVFLQPLVALVRGDAVDHWSSRGCASTISPVFGASDRHVGEQVAGVEDP